MTTPLDPPLPSDRSFCLTFATVFALIGAWMLFKSSAFFGVPLGASAFFLVAAFAFPAVLHPLNVAWMRRAGVMDRVGRAGGLGGV